MDRRVFRDRRWPGVAGLVVSVVAAAVLGAGPVLGGWYSPLLVVVLPTVLVASGVWALWTQVIRAPWLEFDGDGLAVVSGSRRFDLPWDQIRLVGPASRASDGREHPILVAWPLRPPLDDASGNAAYDRTIGGYVLYLRNSLAATDEQLATAVNRYAPGRWGVPED